MDERSIELTLQELAHSQGIDENTDYPDAADYQAPFGEAAEKSSERSLLSDMKKQLDQLPSKRMQERYEMKRELDELREEIRQDRQEMRDERSQELQEMLDNRKELSNEMYEMHGEIKNLVNAVKQIADNTEESVKENEQIAN